MGSVTTILDWISKAVEKASDVNDHVVSPLKTVKEEVDTKEAEKQYKVYSKENKHGDGVCHKLILQSCKKDGQAYLICPPDDAIPIIVIPDFMGTNLKNKKTTSEYAAHGVDKTPDDKVWCMDDLNSAAQTWKNKPADVRKRNLYPPNTEICDGMNYTEEETIIELDDAKERGWCKVSKFVYWEFLNWLQITMNDFASHENGARQNLFDASFTTESEFVQSYEYCYPVYAFPYNWMLGNSENAGDLSTEITKIIQREKNKGKNVQQVLLITHGNGGQIARACATTNASLIKGVIHIALPVNGVPEIYRRIKSGSARTVNQRMDAGIKKSVESITMTNLTDNIKDNIKDLPKDPWTYAGAAVSVWQGSKIIGKFSSKAKAIAGDIAKGSMKGVLKGAAITLAATTATDIYLSDEQNKQYAYIDGYSEQDVAVIAAMSPTYLQMLPSKDYANFYIEKESAKLGKEVWKINNKWLEVKGKLYPQENNPIDEIYLSNEFWGLYKDQSMNYGIAASEKFYTQPDQFSILVDVKVRSFHEEICKVFHGTSVIINGLLNAGSTPSLSFANHDNPTELKTSESSWTSSESSTSVKKYYFGDGIIPVVSSETMFEQSDQKIRSTLFQEFEHHKPFTNTVKQIVILSILQMVSDKQGKFDYSQIV